MSNPIGKALILVSRDQVDLLTLTLINLYSSARKLPPAQDDAYRDIAVKDCEDLLRSWYAQIPLTPEEKAEQDYALGVVYPK